MNNGGFLSGKRKWHTIISLQKRNRHFIKHFVPSENTLQNERELNTFTNEGKLLKYNEEKTFMKLKEL